MTPDEALQAIQTAIAKSAPDSQAKIPPHLLSKLGPMIKTLGMTTEELANLTVEETGRALAAAAAVASKAKQSSADRNNNHHQGKTNSTSTSSASANALSIENQPLYACTRCNARHTFDDLSADLMLCKV